MLDQMRFIIITWAGDTSKAYISEVTQKYFIQNLFNLKPDYGGQLGGAR